MFPAYAGVILNAGVSWKGSNDVPRIRGGDPEDDSEGISVI